MFQFTSDFGFCMIVGFQNFVSRDYEYIWHFDSATHPNKKKFLANVLPCCLERNPTKRRQRSDLCLFQVQHK